METREERGPSADLSLQLSNPYHHLSLQASTIHSMPSSRPKASQSLGQQKKQAALDVLSFGTWLAIHLGERFFLLILTVPVFLAFKHTPTSLPYLSKLTLLSLPPRTNRTRYYC